MGDRSFATVCRFPVAGPGREARCRFVMVYELVLSEIMFVVKPVNPFFTARLTVNGRTPDNCFGEFTILPVVPASTNEGPTRVPFILKPADVMEISSTNSSGGDARLSCGLKGFVKEAP
jgi:hypothetical protein